MPRQSEKRGSAQGPSAGRPEAATAHVLARTLVELRKRAAESRRMARMISRMEENAWKQADDDQRRVQELEALLEPQPRGSGPRRKSQGTNSRQTEMSDGLLRRMAQEGVDHLTLSRAADGSATLTLPDIPPLHLSPRLADLVELLRSEVIGRCGDDLVGYKTMAQICSRLGKRGEKPITPHAALNLISRLRSVLRDAGANPYLVQRDQRGRYRLAIRRPATVTDCDPL